MFILRTTLAVAATVAVLAPGPTLVILILLSRKLSCTSRERTIGLILGAGIAAATLVTLLSFCRFDGPHSNLVEMGSGLYVAAVTTASAALGPCLLAWMRCVVGSPERRRRTFLWTAILVGIVAVCFQIALQSAHRQRDAVLALEEGGADVTYYHFMAGRLRKGAPPPGPTWLRRMFGDDFFTTVIEVRAPRISDSRLKHLRGLPHLKFLVLGPAVTNTGLEEVSELTELTDLRVDCSQVTDAGLVHLKQLRHLQRLSLSQTKLTDAGLQYLTGLSRLQELSLNCPGVTDAGLEHLKGLTQLEWLYLDSTGVSDAGLENLKSLTRLKSLGLLNTRVTAEGVTRLQQAIPNCRISRGRWEGVE